MKKWIAIALLLFLAFPTFAGADTTDTAFEQQLRAADDSTRLRMLLKRAKRYKPQDETKTDYIDELLAEAQRQHDDRYQCEAYLLYTYAAFNRYDLEGVDQWMARLEPLARSNKLYDLIFLGKRATLRLMLIKGQFELQEQEANKVLDEARKLNDTTGMITAYECLAYGYSHSYRNGLALEALEKAFDLASQIGNRTFMLELSRSLTEMCELMGKPQEWLKYLHIREELCKKKLQNVPDSEVQAPYRGDMMLTYISYVEYYLQAENISKAQEALQLAGRFYSEAMSPMHRQMYYTTCRKYYTYIGDYAHALQASDSTLSILRAITDISYYKELSDKAGLLARMDRETEALALYKQVRKAKDSLQLALLDKQTEQIKASYDADRLLLEKERIQGLARTALLVTLCLLLAGLGCLVCYTRRAGGKLRRAEAEMGRMAEEVGQANAAKDKFLSGISQSIRTPLDELVGNSMILSSDESVAPEDKERLSASIIATADRLMTMVNNILTLSKLEAGMMKLTIGEVELLACLRDIAGTLTEGKGFDIVVDFPEGREYRVEIDTNYFSQMVGSLLAAPAEGCSEIRLGIRESESGQLHLTVSGTGLAIAAATQETSVRNEINRMLAECFGGRYEVHTDQTPPYILIVLPAVAAS